MDIVPGLEMLGQKERLEFKAYPGCIGNSRVTERGCVSKKKKKMKTSPTISGGRTDGQCVISLP